MKILFILSIKYTLMSNYENESHNLRIDINNNLDESTVDDPDDIIIGVENDEDTDNQTTWSSLWKIGT
ncbi:MAG: hypothetical protein ACW967_10950 [Candidatus Hodarchaeales archaeon]